MATPIAAPASYVNPVATGHSAADGSFQLTSKAAPMPVSVSGPTTSQAGALSGTTAASTLIGPFFPVAGVPVIVTLDGTWTGTAQLMRSTNGGATLRALTIGGAVWGRFTANACEPVWEEGNADAGLYLQITLTSGTLNYEIGQ